MKKVIITTLATIFTLMHCFSQDVITKKSGEEIQAKIIEVGQTEIKYNKFDNLSGPIYIMPKSDVSMIQYENGTKDIFNEESKTENVSSSSSSTTDLFLKGQLDALKYYKKYKGAGTGTLITSLISPLVGLIPAIACSTTKPKKTNLNYPDENLMNESSYFYAYTERSKKIKQSRVWKNWAIAFTVNMLAILIITSEH
jgi:hypothetical protein